MSTRVKQLIAGIIAVVLGLFVMHFGVDYLCSIALTEEKYDEAEDALKRASSRMESLVDDTAAEWGYLDDIMQPSVDTIAWLLDRSDVFREDLDALGETWGIYKLYIVDSEGHILQSSDHETSAASLDELGLAAFAEHKNITHGTTRMLTDTGYYYISALDDGNYVVGGAESPEKLEYLEYLSQPSTALDGIRVSQDGYVIAVRLSDGVIVYSEDENVNGRKFDEVCNIHLPANGYNDWLTIGDHMYYAWGEDVSLNAADYRLFALISYEELFNTDIFALATAQLSYLVSALLILLYSVFLRDDLMNSSMATNLRYKRLSEQYYINVTILRRLVSITMISMITILGVGWYVQALSCVSRQRNESIAKLDYVEDTLKERADDYNDYLKIIDDEYTNHRAKSIAWAISKDPTLIDDDELTTLALRSGVTAINIYDGEGRMQATTTTYKDITLTTDPGDPYYAFWDIVKGYKETVNVAANEEDSSYYGLYKYMAAKRIDADGRGMVQIGVSNARFSEMTQTTNSEHVLKSFDDDRLMVLDNETGSIIYTHNGTGIGKSCLEYGLTKNALGSDYTGWQNINGIYCFFMTRAYDDMLLCYCIPTMGAFLNALGLAAFTALITGLLLFVLVFLASLTDKSSIVATLSTSKKTYSQRVSYTVIDHEGRLVTTQSADSRWSGDAIPFRRMNAGQKLSFIARTGISVGFLAVLCGYYHNIDNYGSLVSFIASCRWDYSPNLFSVTYSLLYGVQILIIAAILRTVINVISRQFDSRIKTIGRMLESFIKYAAAISILYETLLHLGVEAKALTTGTGLLTLVIGLGANNMISDVIAGIFIVFEGDYRVGDIVTIDKWRGTVQEIGIRTTKIISPGKDIKIIRNSAASGVVNMTRQYSIASVEFSVPASKDLTEMESHIDVLLADIKKNIPELTEGPVYSGVVSYSAGTATLRISAFCKEADRDEVTNKLNRELKLMFDRARNSAQK